MPISLLWPRNASRGCRDTSRGELQRPERRHIREKHLLRGVTFPALGSRCDSGIPWRGLHGQRHCLFAAPPGVVLSLRERKYPKRSLRDRKLRGGLCRAGVGHRDFDSPGQVSGKSIEITKLVCSPLAMCIAIAQCSVSLMYGADESHNGKASKSQTLLAHPYLSFVSISWAIFDRPPAATDARESETKRDSAYLMIDTNLRRISSWMAW
jgi:hypothetical protein